MVSNAANFSYTPWHPNNNDEQTQPTSPAYPYSPVYPSPYPAPCGGTQYTYYPQTGPFYAVATTAYVRGAFINPNLHQANETLFEMAEKLSDIVLGKKVPVMASSHSSQSAQSETVNQPSVATDQTMGQGKGVNVNITNIHIYNRVQRFHSYRPVLFDFLLIQAALNGLSSRTVHHHHYHVGVAQNRRNADRRQRDESNTMLRVALGVIGAVAAAVFTYLAGRATADYKNIKEDIDSFKEEVNKWNINKLQPGYLPLNQEYAEDVEKVIKAVNRIQTDMKINKIWNMILLISFAAASAACVVTAFTGIGAIALPVVAIASAIGLSRLFKYGYDSVSNDNKKAAKLIEEKVSQLKNPQQYIASTPTPPYNPQYYQ